MTTTLAIDGIPGTFVPAEPTAAMREAAFGPIMHGGRGGPVSADFIRQSAALSTQRTMLAAADPSLTDAVVEMRGVLATIVETDDGAIAEMRAMGLEPDPQTVALTERARAVLARIAVTEKPDA